jgi:hypothetical protein
LAADVRGRHFEGTTGLARARLGRADLTSGPNRHRFSCMRKLVVLPLIALFLVATAIPAFADDAGGRTYTWPAHCNTAVTLYMHTWHNVYGNHIDGRFEFYTCAQGPGNDVGALQVVIQYMKLWRHRPGISDCGYYWCQVASGGGHTEITQNGGTWYALWSTKDPECSDGSGSPVMPGDTVHAEAYYQIYFGNGPVTNWRDDNSYDWTINNVGQCS